MEPSEELRQVVTRFLNAVREGDVDAFDRRISRHPGTELIGSAPDEWAADGETGARVFGKQLEEIGGLPAEIVGQVHAEAEGTVGWASALLRFDAADNSAEVRITTVLHLEAGEWRVVQLHFSIPVPNEDVFDVHLTTLEGIVDAVSATRPDLSSASAADGTVTIVFTDIVDSTHLNSLVGDRAWLEVLSAHDRLVRDATAAYGGTVVKGIGDGFMLAFPSARRALDTAKAIERSIADTFNDPGSPIRVRIGVHTGEVMREAEDFFGHAVNYAARVAGAAAGGQILVSALVHDLVAPTGEFAFTEGPTAEFKGIEGSQQLYELALG